MCTLTWHDQLGGYRVFFNRDERRERKPAIAPAVYLRGDSRFLAPLDGDFGGTWIAANEFGVCACLLNGFPSPGAEAFAHRHDYTSRGHLTVSVIGHPTVERAAATLREMDMEPFRPFVLFVIEPGGGLLARWSGRELRVTEKRPSGQPIVSSSFFTKEVRKSRVAVFREMRESPAATDPTQRHLAYHRSHAPARGPHSPCMHRPDASTVSLTQVSVDETRVRVEYTPGPPCREVALAPAAVLPRRRPGQ